MLSPPSLSFILLPSARQTISIRGVRVNAGCMVQDQTISSSSLFHYISPEWDQGERGRTGPLGELTRKEVFEEGGEVTNCTQNHTLLYTDAALFSHRTITHLTPIHSPEIHTT